MQYTTDHFFVEIEHQRFTRHDARSLYHLLTYVDPGPAYTKAGKLRVHQPPPYQDKSQNFYIAQLYHYGLEPRNSKQEAKNALLAAFKNGRSILTVPESVRRVEKDLADEYRVKNAAAAEEHHRKQREYEEAERGRQKKRKREHEHLLAEALGEDSEEGSPSSKKKPKLSEVSFQFFRVISKGKMS